MSHVSGLRTTDVRRDAGASNGLAVGRLIDGKKSRARRFIDGKKSRAI
jgi:hypothetical protein